MMDMAANHTSIEHAWFQESRSSKDNPRRDWYWWRPAREGMEPGEPGAEPTNWKNTLAGSAWKLDETTGEYYLHMFSAKQADLNWENPEVRAAIHDVMRWWLDRGVDGFRLDVINYISKDLPLRDSDDPDSSEAGQEFVLNGPRMHEFLKEMRLEVAGESEWVLSVGEMPTVSLEDACIYTNPDEREIDMVFEINHLMADRGKGKHDLHGLNLPEFKRTFAEWQVALHNVGWNSLYLSNHDQARHLSRFGDDGEYRVESAKMLATILHMMQLPGRFEFTVVTHGDQSGNELKEQLAADLLTLEIEDTPLMTVRPELIKHSVVGSGPTAVHRIQATLWLAETDAGEESLEMQIQRMRVEIRQLWAEVAELKAHRIPAPRPKPNGLRQSLQAGTTMIETDIDVGEVDDSQTD